MEAGISYVPLPEILEKLTAAFTYHAPNSEQPVRYQIIRAAAKDLALQLVHLCPASRELSLALTKLEEAVFWANAGIARNE